MPKARKIHQCSFCGRPILPGCLYFNTKLTPWDGVNDSFGTWKEHYPCHEVTERFVSSEWYYEPDGIKEGDYWEIIDGGFLS